MLKYFIIALAVNFFISTLGTPILDGEDVGKVKKKGKKVTVTGQNVFPYVVLVQIKETKLGITNLYKCGGVIISLDAVLTAAHCIYDIIHPTITVHAGIVHLKHEKDDGQKIEVKDHLIHQYFRDECPVDKNRCCVGVNDIAILWTIKNFEPGTNVRIAALNTNFEKPVNTKGWIVGWGATKSKPNPSMLQKGLVKVLPENECDRFNPGNYITKAGTMCLSPVSKKTRANRGDSGGPFVIGGVVYGLSSLTIKKESCQPVNVFTYVAIYTSWIFRNLADGPPKERVQTTPKQD